jgi:diacylglycerol kinase (ATP)
MRRPDTMLSTLCLHRVLGWEPVKLQNRDDSLSVTEALRKFVHDITDAREGYLDRWKLDLQSTSELKHCDDVQDAHAHDGEDENPNGYMLNYFSVGVDAKVALGFHRLRQERPSLFKSRWLNKLMYTRFGAPEALLHTCYHLPSSVSLEVDGCQVRIPAQCEGEHPPVHLYMGPRILF